MPSLVKKTLRDDRRALLGWAVGIGVFVAVYVSFYPAFQDQTLQARQDAVPEGFRDFMGAADFTSGAGYLQATVYSLIPLILLVLFATLLGNKAIAGPEEAGTLDLLLANPISRRRFALQRYAALAAGIVAVSLVPWALVLLLEAQFDMGVGAANVSAASVGMLLVALCFGTLAFAVGAATGSKAAVLAVTGVAAVGTYLINGLGGLVDGVRPLRWLSPFHYYLGSDPLHHGFHLGYLLVLVGIVVALVVLAAAAFERRDVGV
jgi:ABC-2 type transport system permease protein